MHSVHCYIFDIYIVYTIVNSSIMTYYNVSIVIFLFNT